MVTGVSRQLGARFAATGFADDRVDAPPDFADDPAAGEPQMPSDGRYHLIATLPRRDGPSLLFNAHIDVVPP